MPTRTREAQAPGIDAILERAAGYLPPDRLDLVRDAYAFAAECHDGQTRRTGAPYIVHPLEVTKLVADLELDHAALAAALLHDVQEDCGIANGEIAERFGDEVAHLVEGLTKLDKLPLRVGGADGIGSSDQAQNLRKMFLAMAEDVRVVLVKLCDRLHNMRTLWALSPEKQERISRETMDIYARSPTVSASGRSSGSSRISPSATSNPRRTSRSPTASPPPAPRASDTSRTPP